MDLTVVILLSSLSASLIVFIVAQNAQLSKARLVRCKTVGRRRAVYGGKYRLPPPGVNLDLYRRTKGLLDGMKSDRDEARKERDEALERLARSDDALESAQEILKQLTHQKMEFRVDKSKPKDRNRIAIVL